MTDLDHIEPDLRPLAVPISELKTDPHQVQEHDGRSIAEIERSLQAHGQKKPVIVERATGYVKAGNGTLEAANRLGWTHLAAVRSDDTEEDIRLYAIRDNRTAQFARWIGEKVVAELAALDVEPDEAGWSVEELAALEDGAGVFNVDTVEPPSLSSDDREPFQQMTFTLHDDQVATVKEAMSKASDMGAGSTLNENSNGNALAFICERFLSG